MPSLLVDVAIEGVAALKRRVIRLPIVGILLLVGGATEFRDNEVPRVIGGFSLCMSVASTLGFSASSSSFSSSIATSSSFPQPPMLLNFPVAVI